ncbi:cytochrome P450 [Hypoxylon sp. NC1633]|nr:cytochrome P450 [Hypoxylon sp. NC1633]
MASYVFIFVSLLAAFLPILTFRAVRWLLATRRPANFPPGPPTRLGYGNFHQIPKTYSFLKIHEWAKKYGPMTGLKIGTQNVVLLNDGRLVHEFLVKRAALVHARPEVYIAQKHVLPDLWPAYNLFSPAHEANLMRVVAKEYLIGSGLHKLAPIQKASATRLITKLLDTGESEWMEQVLNWVLITPAAFMAGVSPEDLGKNWIQEYHNSQRMFLKYIDPEYFPRVDIFPILRWVPAVFAEWKRKAGITREAIIDAWKPLIEAGRNFQRGSFRSFSTKLVTQASDPSVNLSEAELPVFIGGLFDATWTSTIMSFNNMVHVFASHPEVQRKAQAEIDEAFGKGDGPLLPENIDLDKLPYLSACVTEMVRWRPLSSYAFGPFGLPRETTADINISGYHIPKGTAVVINQWSIAHDEEFYDDPASFIPERWLRDPMGAKEGVSQLHRKFVYAFGAGRRECLGKDYFFQNTRIVFAQILRAFDIRPVEKLDTDPTSGYLPSLVLQAKPFKVNWVPRRENTRELIDQEKMKADAKLSEFLG